MPLKALSISQRRPARDIRVSAHRRGYDRNWQRLREWHLKNNPFCVFCFDGATMVDHIRPISAGGEALDADNLRSTCQTCHAKLTANYRATGRNEMPVTK